jgi:hypothetical protein
MRNHGYSKKMITVNTTRTLSYDYVKNLSQYSLTVNCRPKFVLGTLSVYGLFKDDFSSSDYSVE